MLRCTLNKSNLLRQIFRILCIVLLLIAFIEIFWSQLVSGADEKKVETKSDKTSESTTEQTSSHEKITSTDPKVVIQELEQKQALVESKIREFEDKEKQLKEQEKSIDQKLKELDALRAAVTQDFDSQKKNNEERVLKIVTVFETMSPKSAASVLENLDDWLAVEVLKKMDFKKIAKLMNIMDKSRSAKLSEMLTGYYKPELKREISSSKSVSPATGQAADPSKAVESASPKPAMSPAPQAPGANSSQKKGGT